MEAGYLIINLQLHNYTSEKFGFEKWLQTQFLTQWQQPIGDKDSESHYQSLEQCRNTHLPVSL